MDEQCLLLVQAAGEGQHHGVSRGSTGGTGQRDARSRRRLAARILGVGGLSVKLSRKATELDESVVPSAALLLL